MDKWHKTLIVAVVELVILLFLSEYFGQREQEAALHESVEMQQKILQSLQDMIAKEPLVVMPAGMQELGKVANKKIIPPSVVQ